MDDRLFIASSAGIMPEIFVGNRVDLLPRRGDQVEVQWEDSAGAKDGHDNTE